MISKELFVIAKICQMFVIAKSKLGDRIFVNIGRKKKQKQNKKSDKCLGRFLKR